jgi:hypothetical protein
LRGWRDIDAIGLPPAPAVHPLFRLSTRRRFGTAIDPRGRRHICHWLARRVRDWNIVPAPALLLVWLTVFPRHLAGSNLLRSLGCGCSRLRHYLRARLRLLPLPSAATLLPTRRNNIDVACGR